ncbi:MAG: hypothetical protein LBG24_10860 [Treponema sp.]|jgi:hypothetical protein|nr:hypothetical protein [Treponema sp.]
MFNIDEEKDRLATELSEQYSRNIITMEEYERILEYINKIETKKELNIIERIIQENKLVNDYEVTITRDNKAGMPKIKENHFSMFSWRTLNLESIQGNGGNYTSLFGANRIIVDNLPGGRTRLNVNAIFGLIEIIVPKNVKIITRAAPIFSGIFVSDEIKKSDEALLELYIIGKAIFGNITIKTAEEKAEEMRKEKEFEKRYEEKYKEKILRKIK